jgi:pantothenate kinase type III
MDHSPIGITSYVITDCMIIWLCPQALKDRTAALPLVPLPPVESPLPTRFAMGTAMGIQSGVVYAALATIEDFCNAFWEEHGEGAVVVLTGGDSALLHAGLQQRGMGRGTWVLHGHLAHVGMHWVAARRDGDAADFEAPTPKTSTGGGKGSGGL